jgi:prepilin-type processing-associated H-X9-DG protein
VTDGTSKTYFCGEKYLDPNKFEDNSDPDTGNNETWCTGHNNDNFRTTADPPKQDQQGYEDGNLFGSAHSSVWNVAFCDGHVEAIGYDIDPKVHKSYGNRKDGQVFPQQSCKFAGSRQQIARSTFLAATRIHNGSPGTRPNSKNRL